MPGLIRGWLFLEMSGPRNSSGEELVAKGLAVEGLPAEDMIVEARKLLCEEVSRAHGKCAEDCKSRHGAIEENVMWLRCLK